MVFDNMKILCQYAIDKLYTLSPGEIDFVTQKSNPYDLKSNKELFQSEWSNMITIYDLGLNYPGIVFATTNDAKQCHLCIGDLLAKKINLEL